MVGRNLCGHLHARGGWEVIGLSRRSPGTSVPCTHLAIDLTDRASCVAKLAAHPDVTHLFYAARAPQADPLEEANLNRDMLANLVGGFQGSCRLKVKITPPYLC